MSDLPTTSGNQDEPEHYAIRVRGHLDSRWSGWFDGMTITLEGDGTTVLAGPVVDQAALHGLLRKVRDMSLTLVAVSQENPRQ